MHSLLSIPHPTPNILSHSAKGSRQVPPPLGQRGDAPLRHGLARWAAALAFLLGPVLQMGASFRGRTPAFQSCVAQQTGLAQPPQFQASPWVPSTLSLEGAGRRTPGTHQGPFSPGLSWAGCPQPQRLRLPRPQLIARDGSSSRNRSSADFTCLDMQACTEWLGSLAE